MICDRISIKNMTLYPPAKPSSDTEIPSWIDLEEEEYIQPLLTFGRALNFKIETEYDTIYNFIRDPTSITK